MNCFPFILGLALSAYIGYQIYQWNRGTPAASLGTTVSDNDAVSSAEQSHVQLAEQDNPELAHDRMQRGSPSLTEWIHFVSEPVEVVPIQQLSNEADASIDNHPNSSTAQPLSSVDRGTQGSGSSHTITSPYWNGTAPLQRPGKAYYALPNLGQIPLVDLMEPGFCIGRTLHHERCGNQVSVLHRQHAGGILHGIRSTQRGDVPLGLWRAAADALLCSNHRVKYPQGGLIARRAALEWGGEDRTEKGVGAKLRSIVRTPDGLAA